MQGSNGTNGKSGGSKDGGTVTTEKTALGLSRRYTKAGVDPLAEIKTTRRDSVIHNPDGSTVFEMRGVEVPADWSQLATDIVVSKYFRKAGVPGETGSETSALQVVHRVARSMREAGERLGGYFADEADADVFEQELSYMLVNQMGAFNSPVWFNCGLSARYGIHGRAVGNWYWNEKTGKIEETVDAYSRPQLSACFIQSIKDDLMDIADAVKREMRLFKFGSGTGTNFSRIRSEGERLSGGGTSSGIMSFLEVLDRAAGATKSGGTTRRAAKMVILDMDHPEIERFVLWKAREEDKAQAMIDAGFDSDFNGEVYRTISGQNSNNSVRITDDFMKSVEEEGDWKTYYRTTGKVANTHKASDLMDKISYAAWRCADPGVQFDTSINRWHTCPNTDRIHGSNPCSEYMFLDDSACNLASLNLIKFLRDDGTFDVEAYRHAVRVFFIAQEIAVDFASYPTETVAKNSHDYRPLGLGYANLGSLLMLMGVPYDSDEGRVIAGAISAMTCGHAYRVSAEMAREKAPFNGFDRNREPMLRVMNQHRAAAHALETDWGHEDLVAAARDDWDQAVALGEEHGYRNAQSTVIAPTGTIGLLMDCDTTGIEPDFSLVKFKKLAGGGHFKIINQSVPRALENLGYGKSEVQDVVNHILGHQTLDGCPQINHTTLQAKGLLIDEIEKAEKVLASVFALGQAFRPHVIGEKAYERLGVTKKAREAADFNLLETLGFAEDQIEAAEDWACGTQTIEGAPHLLDEHLPVFDCANRCGRTGTRFIHHMGHIRMMAAVQPFISGAISKTINMPPEVTTTDIREAYFESWRLGLKAVALYRDGCKASQPLSSSGSKKKKADTGPETKEATPVTLDAAQRPLRRRRLPKKRFGFTQETKIGGQKVYLRTGNYEDGTLGEIFIDMHKEGAAFRSMMNCFAISTSLGLQYGVPLEEFVNVFTFTRFDPQGPVDHPNIKWSTSVIDFIFRVLAMEYQGRTDFVHVQPADGPESSLEQTPKGKPEPDDLKARLKDFEETVAETAAGTPSANFSPENRGVMPQSGDRSQLSGHLSTMMGDAPFCEECGHITVRNAACYRCLNCGHSMGCS